jgi:DNA-binding NtrC family response regulator
MKAKGLNKGLDCMEQQKKSPVVLSFENNTPQPLSIRARALVFSDPASQKLLEYIERLAPSEAPVLIYGETGTGKELVARHIHQMSGRKGPFLAVNCGAITENLAESELFGHEAGAFTGAAGRREGWFESANGGTLFLDEIGDLPLPLQVKLLRVVQEREVVRVGARKALPVDVRLITATNVDLDQAVAAGRFRRDLHYRLNIAQVSLPPLRERLNEIIPLANHFISLYAHKMGIEPPRLSQASERILLHYPWQGNIRELENVVHFALLIAPGSEIHPEHLKITFAANPVEIAAPGPFQPAESAPVPEPETVSQDKILGGFSEHLRQLFTRSTPRLFDRVEGLIVQDAFHHAGRNQVHAAALLGVTRNVMRTLLKRYGLIGGNSGEQESVPGLEDGAAEESWQNAELDTTLFQS